MKTTLEVNGNKGPGIGFEQVQFSSLIDDNLDEMYGDQLLGHPSIREIREIRESKEHKIVPIKDKKTITDKINRIIKKIRKD